MAKKRTLDKDLSFMKTIVRNKYVRNYEDQNRQKTKLQLKNSGVRIMKLKKFDKFQKVYVIVLEL